jgi:hypothetical protein
LATHVSQHVKVAKDLLKLEGMMRTIPISLIVFLGSLFSAQASGQVSGTIVDGNTGRPIADVQVRIGSVSARTNSEGRYELNGIAFGKGLLTTDKPGYVAAHPDNRTGVQGIPIETRQNGTAEVNLHLWVAPIVSGHIVDLQGLPVQGATVMPFRLTYSDTGELVSEDLGTSSRRLATDDRGDFRFNWLEPGEYSFRAFLPAMTLDDLKVRYFYPSYFPGVKVRQSAGIVLLRSGEELNLGTWTMPSGQGAGIHVHVAYEREPPRLGTQIVLRSTETGGIVRSGILSRAATLAEIAEVPAGSYEVEVIIGELRGHTFVEVGQSNVDAVVLIPENAKLRAHVVKNTSEGQAPIPIAGILLELKDTRGNHLVSLGATGNDGITYAAEVSAGTYRVNVSRIPPGFYLAAFQAGGQNVLRDLIEVRPSRDLDIVMRLEELSSIIQGVVSDSHGTIAPGSTVALVPDDRTQDHQYFVSDTDANGAFEIPCAAGHYHIYAWNDTEGAAYRNGEFMKKYDDRGIAIHLEKGSKLNVDLMTIERN